MGVRTFGVEEELLLVDPDSGEAVPCALSLMEHSRQRPAPTLPAAGRIPDGQAEVRLATEFQREQIEVIGPPQSTLDGLRAGIVAGRAFADACAQAAGARVAALATSPLVTAPCLAPDGRVQVMADRYGVTARQQLTNGYHIHVGIRSDEEGVAVLDRIRIWLPVLAALACNSPFRQGADTGYAGFRTQLWSRWPSTGPSEIYGSAAAYRDLAERMIGTGVVLDRAMLYLDARLSRNYPTVEIRVADVCLRADDAVLVAGLARALVETAARDWRSGKPAEPVPASLLRLAAWQASRWGMEGRLLHPVSAEPREAAEVVGLLLEHVREALADCGDAVQVERLCAQLLARGTGARQQREAFDSTGSLRGVVAEAVRLTQPEPAAEELTRSGR